MQWTGMDRGVWLKRAKDFNDVYNTIKKTTYYGLFRLKI